MKESRPAVAPLEGYYAPKAKQPWRKPTLTFMPLQVTAIDAGSGTDGAVFEFTS